ncbi:MAG: hypothetical protein ACLP4V_34380 [Methylocella sp.]
MSMAKGTEMAKAADNVTETTDIVPFKAFIAQNAEFNSNILTIATETTNYSKKVPG